ncbi:MAG: hypothetical protein Q7J25_12065 [Vicinamibacterales bacterium]|nr:hypothetical protein [Vicinamibacterales bacterium]
MTKAKEFALMAALLIAVGVLTGCEASVGTPDDATQLEGIIKKQLAGKVADKVENPVVDEVTCVEGAAKKYDCVAKITYDGDKGGRKSEDVAIEGSCDDKNCIWETK